MNKKVSLILAVIFLSIGTIFFNLADAQSVKLNPKASNADITVCAGYELILNAAFQNAAQKPNAPAEVVGAYQYSSLSVAVLSMALSQRYGMTQDQINTEILAPQFIAMIEQAKKNKWSLGDLIKQHSDTCNTLLKGLYVK